MKTCFKCERTLPLEEFHRHPKMADGHLGKCKACACQDVRENRQRRIKHYMTYDKKRMMLPHRVQRRRKYDRENPKGRKARIAVSNAVRRGKLIRQPCEVCGNLKSLGHHPDYAKRLEVRWLCHQHHAAVHRSSVNA